MRTLGLIRRASSGPPHDLWPRLRARLADDDVVALRFPALGWLEATAFAVAVGTLVRRAGSRPLPLRVRAAVMVRRRDLLAYLIGAGVAGTLLTAPYALRLAAISLLPGATIGNVPFFLLPDPLGRVESPLGALAARGDASAPGAPSSVSSPALR